MWGADISAVDTSDFLTKLSEACGPRLTSMNVSMPGLRFEFSIGRLVELFPVLTCAVFNDTNIWTRDDRGLDFSELPAGSPLGGLYMDRAANMRGAIKGKPPPDFDLLSSGTELRGNDA
jgi:hypothetical protein